MRAKSPAPAAKAETRWSAVASTPAGLAVDGHDLRTQRGQNALHLGPEGGLELLRIDEPEQAAKRVMEGNAVLDRLTDQAHIIETGAESYRFRRTLRKKSKD